MFALRVLVLLSSPFFLRVGFDPAQLATPVLSEQAAPVVNDAKRVGIGSIERPPPVAAHRDQVDIEQDLEVFGHRRLLERERVGDLADRSLFAGDEFENLPSPWFGDGVERIRRRGGACHRRQLYIPIWEYVKRRGRAAQGGPHELVTRDEMMKHAA